MQHCIKHQLIMTLYIHCIIILVLFFLGSTYDIWAYIIGLAFGALIAGDAHRYIKDARLPLLQNLLILPLDYTAAEFLSLLGSFTAAVAMKYAQLFSQSQGAMSVVEPILDAEKAIAKHNELERFASALETTLGVSAGTFVVIVAVAIFVITVLVAVVKRFRN